MCGMEKIDIVLWVMSGGFGLMLVMWHYLTSKIEATETSLNKKIDCVETSLNKRIDCVETSLNKRIDGIEHKIDKIDEKVTDIDRRLCRLEGAFSSKDCCMIKDDRQLKKAE